MIEAVQDRILDVRDRLVTSPVFSAGLLDFH